MKNNGLFFKNSVLFIREEWHKRNCEMLEIFWKVVSISWQM